MICRLWRFCITTSAPFRPPFLPSFLPFDVINKKETHALSPSHGRCMYVGGAAEPGARGTTARASGKQYVILCLPRLDGEWCDDERWQPRGSWVFSHRRKRKKGRKCHRLCAHAHHRNREGLTHDDGCWVVGFHFTLCPRISCLARSKGAGPGLRDPASWLPLALTAEGKGSAHSFDHACREGK